MLPHLVWFGHVVQPVSLGLGALGVAAVWRVARGEVGRREVTLLALLLAATLLWVLEVAQMTSDGFSGNVRYLILPAALVCLVAGVGVGWAARALLGVRVEGTGPAAVVAAVLVALAVAVPMRESVRASVEAIAYEARLNGQVAGLVARAGGVSRLRTCGDVYTGPFQVPVVAWTLGVHTTLVQSTPPRRPAVVLQAKSVPTEGLGPSTRSLGDPSDARTLATAPGWRIQAVCRAGA
jgi:hypothetical protein